MADAPLDVDGDEEFTSDQFVQLRDAHKALKREVKELRGFKETAEPRLKANALKAAGFDPESPQAKALLKLHEGEFTEDAIKATAGEFGIAAGGEGESPAGTGDQLTPEQQAAIDSSQRGAALDGVSTPVTPPQTIDAQIAQAQADGDVQRSLELKGLKLARLAQS